MSENSIFSHALYYAELGYKVFPVVPGDKKPIIKGWQNAATTDKTQIEQWIKKHPNANIAIKAEGLLIIDVDTKDDKKGIDDMLEIIKGLGRLPKRPSVKTPTGGWHLYFKHPGVDVTGSTGIEYNGRKTGIDLRVGNQYIVAPPSIHPNGGTYKWTVPLVPIDDIPELPQAWVEGFLPLRNAPTDNGTTETVPLTTCTPHEVLPLKIEGEIEQKAVKYLETCPKSIQGKGGRKALFATAVALVRGLKLEPPRAAEIAWEFYNFYCYPFWINGEQKEFDRMFADAANFKCAKQDGWLIDAIKLDNVTNESLLAWEPFPIDCLPPVLRNFCLAVAQSTNTDPAYTAVSVLPIVASAIGAHIKLNTKEDWQAPAIIWSLVVADSGSGKTPTWTFAIKPLIKKQTEFNDLYEKEMKEHEKIKQKYEEDLLKWRQDRRAKKNDTEPPDKPEQPKKQYCLVSDITTEALIPILENNPFGLCASYNEAAVLLSGMDAYRTSGNKDEGIYNGIFDGGFVQVNRKTGNQDITAHHTHCSINGGIQPNSLKLILKKNPQFLFSGFFARFLLCMPPENLRYYTEASVPREVEVAYGRMIDSLFFWRGKLRGSPGSPYLVKLTPEAKRLFANYHDDLIDDRCSLPSGAMKASLSKLSGYVPRIALTLHVARVASTCPVEQCPPGVPDIDAETMKAAITLTEWFRRETQRVLQVMQPGEVVEGDKEIGAILNHLTNGDRNETEARTVAQNLRPFREAGMAGAEKKLDEMVAKGLLTVEQRKADNGVEVKYYSLPVTANAANANAIFAPIQENSVGVGSVGGTAEVIDDNTDDLIPFGEELPVLQPVPVANIYNEEPFDLPPANPSPTDRDSLFDDLTHHVTLEESDPDIISPWELLQSVINSPLPG